MKEQKFPIEIRQGSARVRIYREKRRKGAREYVNYTVSYFHPPGRRNRASFTKLQDAIREARGRVFHLASGQVSVLKLTPEAAASYQRAVQLLLPTGLSLEVAAAQMAKVHEILKGGDPVEAARTAAKITHDIKPNVLASEVISELLEHRKRKGVGEHHLRVLAGQMKKFGESFPGARIASIDGPAIKTFLDSMHGITNRTRNNYRCIIGQLFRFAKFRRFLPKDHESVEFIEKYREQPADIEIYTPTEMDLLLHHARPELVPFLAIGGFAGVRHREIERLDWKDVSLSERRVTVDAGNAKTARRRVIPMSDNLVQWLAPHQRLFGPVCDGRNMARLIARLKRNRALRQAGFQWKQNALRHSYISYRVAQTNDVPRVALEAGNTPAMIFRHYRQLVTGDSARAWFAILPAADRAVVQLRA